MSEASVSRTNPYVGPRAFDEADADRFFGRTQESRQLSSLVIAHRAVLLYAQSGAGKTSLLQASLVPALKGRKRIVVLPIGRVSGEDRQDATNIFVYNTLLTLYGEEADRERLAQVSLADGLAPLLTSDADERRPRPRLLILDQFEEIFTSHTERYRDRSGFFAQLDECLTRFPQLSLLLAMREDYIAHIDPYVGQLPDRLRTRFRLERLGPEAAKQSVEAPLEGTGRHYGSGVAATLIDNLRRIQRRQLTAAGEELVYELGPYVEPVHLQIVCQQLWDRLPADRQQIEVADIQQFGDVDQALRSFYESALQGALPLAGMGERLLRGWIEQQLITSSGTRALIFRGESSTAGLPNMALDRLADNYVIRPEERAGGFIYELSHDRLVEPILASNRAWREANYNPLAAALAAWQSGGSQPEELPSGTQLDELETYLEEHKADVNLAEISFIQDARVSENDRLADAARRTQRRVIFIAAIVGMVLVVLLVLALVSASTARTNEQLAQAAQETAEAEEQISNELRSIAEVAAIAALVAEETAVAAQATSDSDAGQAIAAQATSEFNAGQAAAAQAAAERLRRVILAQSLASLAGRLPFLNSNDTEQAALVGIAAANLNREVDANAGVLIRSSLEDLLDRPDFNRSLSGHTNDVLSVAWSPDGATLASASDDHTIRLWDVATGEESDILSGHNHSVRSVAWSPDGATLVSASDDHTIRLWDVASGAEIEILSGHTNAVLNVAWSPDGATLASASEDLTIRLWDVATGTENDVLTGHFNHVLNVAWSPDGATLASTSSDKTIRLWDVATGAEIGIFSSPGGAWELSVAWSPDGATLASASHDSTIRLWDVATGSVVEFLRDHTSHVFSLAWSPDGTTLASASGDRSVRLWDIATGEESDILSGHTEAVFSVAWSPDGTTLASASEDLTIRLWKDTSGSMVDILTGHTERVQSVAWSPDGATLASASSDQTIRLWDVAAGIEIDILSNHTDPVWRLAWSPDGTILASAFAGRTTIRLWDVASGSVVNLLSDNRNGVHNMAWSPDSTTLASASGDFTIRLWDVATGAEIDGLSGHTETIQSVAWSPDGTTLASASSDQTIRLWDVATGAEIDIFRGHTDPVWSVAWSPDGNTIASASIDHTIRLWDIATGVEIYTLIGHTESVFSVAWSPDGATLASASSDQTIRLWDVATGVEIDTLTGHTDLVLNVAWSPDGTALASASADDTVRLWLSEAELIHRACNLVSRNLTWAEWQEFLPDEPYAIQCDNHPLPDDLP